MLNNNFPLGRVSIPSVNQYLQLAQEQGLYLDQILFELELSQTLLNNNSEHICGVKFQQLLHEVINLSKDPLFGLHTAKFVQPSTYSVLGFITMNCDTLGEVISKIQPFEKLVGDMGNTLLTEDKKNFYLSWSCQFTDTEVRRHMIDNCLASWFTFSHYLLQDNHQSPLKVLLMRSTPNLKQIIAYQQLFHCSVLFNQKTNTIVFDKSLLNLPLYKGNKALRVNLETYAENQIRELNQTDIIKQTTDLIEQHLTSHQLNQEDIAQLLGMSYKTLQRRLKQKHTHFKQLVNQVRMKKCDEILPNTEIPLTQVSEILGFNEPRSFFRWFQQQHQTTPGQYRQNLT